MINTRTLNLIKHFESLHDGDLSVIGLTPKLDPVGIWTEGWGHAMRSADGKGFLRGAKDKAAALKRAKVLTEEDADALLEKDLERFELSVKRLVDVPLHENQYGAVVSLVFNIGEGNFQSSTLLKMLNVSNFKGAALQFERWDKAGGAVLRGLTLRRKAERALFEKQPRSQ